MMNYTLSTECMKLGGFRIALILFYFIVWLLSYLQNGEHTTVMSGVMSMPLGTKKGKKKVGFN